MWKSFINAMTFAVILFTLGCSSIYDGNPATMTDDANAHLISADSDSQHMLWGIWNIRFDETNLEAAVVPIRNAQPHFNITDMITPPACDDCLGIAVNSFDPVTRIMDVDVTLRNKFSISGCDVRGILHTNDYGHLLTNPDGWTSLWDMPGGMAINPFRAFAKFEANRIFAGLAEHTENYLVYIPIPLAYFAITFAVDASWPGNCKEPYSFGDFAQGTIYDTAGSSGIVQVDVYDWQNDVSAVQLSAPEITGVEYVDLSFSAGNTWEITLVNTEGAVAGEYDVKVKATSTGPGTSDLYDFFPVTITGAGPAEGWARTWGGSSFDNAKGVNAYDSDNIYVTGYFMETVDFDPDSGGSDEHTSNGSCDAYLSKFNSTGQLQWAHTWGGVEFDKGNDTALDSSGNVYVVGRFSNTVDFNPDPLAEDEHASNGDEDAFLCKYDSAGNYQWGLTWGGSLGEDGYGVAVDTSDNIYVCGFYMSDVDFDPDPVDEDVHPEIQCPDVYLSKFDSSGDFQWARTWGGVDYDQGRAVATCGTDAYVVGCYGFTVDFDPDPVGTVEHTTVGFYDCFVSKFNQTGDFQWVRCWGGSGLDVVESVCTNGSNGVFVGGQFWYTVDFNTGPVVDDRISAGKEDIFLSRFDTDGTYLFTHTFGDIESDDCQGVAVDNSDNVFITGYFYGAVDFDPDPVDEDVHLSKDYDVFLSTYEPSGNFRWARTWGGDLVDVGISVATDDTGRVFVAGKYEDTVDFDPGPGVDEHTSNANGDSFVSMFPPDGNW